MSRLKNALQKCRPRERAGSQTAARYGFQANYCILKIVELREAAEDFRIVFDLFDDLLVFDSAKDPNKAWFYQIKSKDRGDWTTGRLCRAEGAQIPRSIASRLYEHIENFGASVMETGFVSNASFALKLSCGTTTAASHLRIRAVDLADAEKAKYASAATADYASADVPSWIPKLIFLKTPLGVQDQHVFVIGKLQQHLEQTTGVEGVKVSAVYETLYAAVMKRAGFVDDSASVDELIAAKSLSRADFEDLLTNAARRRRSILENWEVIRQDLSAQGMGSVGQIRLQNAAIFYFADRQAGRPSASALSDFSSRWSPNHRAQIDACQSILEVSDILREALAGETFGFDGRALPGALLVEAYEAIHE